MVYVASSLGNITVLSAGRGPGISINVNAFTISYSLNITMLKSYQANHNTLPSK
jgi:hypothetical protein